MKKIALALILGVALFTAAGKGTPTPIHLVHDGGWNGPAYYYGETGERCLGEDSSWKRIWDGDMFAGQVLTASIWKCPTGASGFRVANSVWKGDTNVVVTSPSGILYSLHDLGIIERRHEYLRCWNEMRHGTPLNGGLEAGEWKIALTALTDAKRIRFTVEGAMSWPEWQTAHCIPEDYRTENWPCWPYYRC